MRSSPAALWINDPPHSSFPACIAFKAVEWQSSGLSERYLRRMREAVMTESQNISRRKVLIGLAAEIAEQTAGELDLAQFTLDLESDGSLEAFRGDMMLARYHNVGRFPTLIFRHRRGESLMVVGYRPYVMLRAALLHLAPELERPAPPAEDGIAVEPFSRTRNCDSAPGQG